MTADSLVPTESIMCFALVRPGSDLDRRIGSTAPAYVIYEFDRVFGTYEVRMGDGAWLSVSPADHEDLILLPVFSGARLEAFTGTWFTERADAELMAVARGG
jgi:hypothetical protein